jgi:hypothetical protein
VPASGDIWVPLGADLGFHERVGHIETRPLPPGVADILEPGTTSHLLHCEDGDASVLVSRHPSDDPLPRIRGKWHLSIAHPKRNPTWDDIVRVRYALVPDECWMAQILPPRKEYLNLHQHCFHLYEIDPDPRFRHP